MKLIEQHVDVSVMKIIVLVKTRYDIPVWVLQDGPGGPRRSNLGSRWSNRVLQVALAGV